MLDALLVVFRHFRPRMERIPRFTDADLASLSMPVQVIVGSDDALLNSKEDSRPSGAMRAKRERRLVENAGHIAASTSRALCAGWFEGRSGSRRFASKSVSARPINWRRLHGALLGVEACPC